MEPKVSTQHLNLKELTKQFSSHFPEHRSGARLIGREAEYPVVQADGSAGDVRPILEELTQLDTFEEIREESGMLVEIVGKEYRYSLEVGWGTIELISRPCATLNELEELHCTAMGRLLSVTQQHGLNVLGYGIQPKTPGSTELMSPKKRYGILHDVIGDTWLSFTTTASDQVHVDIDRSELVTTLNLGNMLHPVVVALFANSPIAGGEDTGFTSARDGFMGQIHSASCRHGMTSSPLASVEDWIRMTAQHIFLVRKEEGRYIPENQGSFIEYMQQKGGTFDDFLMHDHYIWNTARARTAHGTIELRAACQQPWSEHMSVAAFSLGLIESASSIEAWLKENMQDDAFSMLRTYGDRVLTQGLHTEEPFSGMLRGILERCQEGLHARGYGEERYIEPLLRRVEEKSNPAMQNSAAFTGDFSEFVRRNRIPTLR